MLGAVGLMEARPPYVRFETRAMERRDAEGLISFVDKDFALVTPQGSKDTVEKLLPEWFDKLKDDVRQGRFPPQWLEGLRSGYKGWKETQEQPVTGTPISNWPAATPAEKKALQQAGVRAIEDLAAANEELLGRVGMGARSLKQRALDWVTAAKDHAPLIAQLNAMRGQLETQQQKMQALEARNEYLEKAMKERELAIPVGLPPVEDRLAAMQPEPRDDKLVDSAIEEAFNG